METKTLLGVMAGMVFGIVLAGGGDLGRAKISSLVNDFEYTGASFYGTIPSEVGIGETKMNYSGTGLLPIIRLGASGQAAVRVPTDTAAQRPPRELLVTLLPLTFGPITIGQAENLPGQKKYKSAMRISRQKRAKH